MMYESEMNEEIETEIEKEPGASRSVSGGETLNSVTSVKEFENKNEREDFVIQATLITKTLTELLEKTKQIEALIIQEIRSMVSETDFYNPDQENIQRPKKRKKTH